MGFSRRDWLTLAAKAGAGSLALRWRGAQAAVAKPALAPVAGGRSCILLYMAGGASHVDTFDLKPEKSSGGSFRAIRTKVDGLRISEHLPRLAARMHKLALIRSMTAKEGNHSRARHLMHTGYAPAGGADHPALGSLLASGRAADEAGAGLPGYVAIGGPGEDAGFLSSAYSPFVVKNPLKPVRYLTLPRGIDAARFDRRLELWRSLESGFSAGRGGTFAQNRREVAEQAVALMRSSEVRSFDLEEESPETRAAYGPSEFGAGCLMARRLCEAGAPFVEVTLNGWDTHEDNFNRVKALCQTLDQGFSALLDDLERRGRLSSTVLVWAGDFGRTPRINEKGGRDHHPAASSVLLAGGGMKPGMVIGETDAEGAEVRERPVTVPDLFRTLAHLLGLEPDRMRMSPAGRPIRTVDGGALITELI